MSRRIELKDVKDGQKVRISLTYEGVVVGANDGANDSAYFTVADKLYYRYSRQDNLIVELLEEAPLEPGYYLTDSSFGATHVTYWDGSYWFWHNGGRLIAARTNPRPLT